MSTFSGLKSNLSWLEANFEDNMVLVFACRLSLSDYLLGLFLNPEDGSIKFLRNVGDQLTSVHDVKN
jgi:hypothetical protein